MTLHHPFGLFHIIAAIIHIKQTDVPHTVQKMKKKTSHPVNIVRD